MTDVDLLLDPLDTDGDIEDVATESDAGGDDRVPDVRPREATSPLRPAMRFGVAVVVALAVLVGWFGFRVYQSHQALAQRNQFLQVARQGALNLSTIDWRHADADVHRILDGATGEFYDDFAKRSQPFIEVLKQAKATTVGTITEAGLESETGDAAQALVAVSVQTSNAGVSEQVPRAWRMRVSVQKVGDQVKVSHVGFVP
ncbi:mammalian cell entry protein [Mycobacterium sp. 663a-19]|uniref:mammalian cell entry protein n=1 Tax=Mycobacterium sp. 663a-19 TaxID=2986148 RepID=UPI002D1E9ACE|nr:mammalian cell entry protein [Mycobacterium sp. 663a-19]MEB3980772.1 mammalian cell entry protein [Mycobacterium sp. 663a-19]